MNNRVYNFKKSFTPTYCILKGDISIEKISLLIWSKSFITVRRYNFIIYNFVILWTQHTIDSVMMDHGCI